MLSNCHFATLTNETHWNATAGKAFPKTDAKPDQIMFPKLCLFKNIAFLKTPPCPTPAPSENVSWVLKPRVGYRPHRGYTIHIDKQAKIFNKRQAALLVYLTSKEENWWPQQSAKPPPRKHHTSSNCESLALHTYPFLAHHWKFLKKRHNKNMKRSQVLDVDNCCYIKGMDLFFKLASSKSLAPEAAARSIMRISSVSSTWVERQQWNQ